MIECSLHPSAMEPAILEPDENLSFLAAELIRSSAALGAGLLPSVKAPIRTILESMNGYYSNLIEGHRTFPKDIEAAVAGEFSADEKSRELQHLHRAHLEAERWMRVYLHENRDTSICSPEFLSRIHERLYSFLPEDLRVTTSQTGKRYPIIPGEFRSYPVVVGRHTAPSHEKLRSFLSHFQERYEEAIRPTQEGIIAALAAHHRFVFIHPFGDGNGRVGRLFTTACLIRCGVDGDGLWSFSRGMARRENSSDYKEMLAIADSQRQGDLDGRGNLSAKGLKAWVSFSLDRCLDQARFMGSILSLEKLRSRVVGLIRLLEEQEELPRKSHLIMARVIESGKLRRGEVPAIISLSPRRSQPVIGQLLRGGFLTSPSAKGELLLGIPSTSAAAFLPNVYPTG